MQYNLVLWLEQINDMVTKTKISIGILLLILLSTGVVYVEWKNDARIRVDEDKATFYVPHDTMPWIWVVSGREYNKLYDGTSLMNRDTKNILVETTYDENSITIKRKTPYIRGPIIIDTYLFNTKEEDIELFPISHKVEVLNAQGKYYRYEVKDLVYDGDTFKLDGKQVSQSFGRNMKVNWWNGYRLGWVYKTGSMYVKSEKLETDYEVFETKLFDPVAYGYNLTLYLDGVQADRKYEYYTVANITANVSVCEEEQCDICIDVVDSIVNLTATLGDKNYTCGNQTVSFLYNITTLRQNEFNDSTLAKNVSNGESVFIDLDNRTDLVQFKFNISSNSSSENVSIDVNEDDVTDVLLLGNLSGPKLMMDYFYSDSIKYHKLNLTRSTPGTKTIYTNMSTSGFFDNNVLENYSFRLDGFDIDAGNNVNLTEQFLVDNGTYNENMSTYPEIESFLDNDSTHWQNTGGTLSVINEQYLQFGHSHGGGSTSGTLEENETNPLNAFNMTAGNKFKINSSLSYGYTCAGQSYADISAYNKFYISDGITDISLFEWNFYINCPYTGCSYCTGGSGSLQTNLEGIKTTETTIDIYRNDVFTKTVDITALDSTIKPYLKLVLSATQGQGTSTYEMNFNMWNMSVGGLSLQGDNSTYPLIPLTNWTSTKWNQTPTTIQRATLSYDAYSPSNTSITAYLSNDDQTTWEEVTNGLIHVFDTSGDNISTRFEMNTSNSSKSPIIYDYTLDISPSPVDNILIDVGADGTDDWSYVNVLNATSSPQYFSTNGTAIETYININCYGEATCSVPTTVAFGSAGTLQVSEFNLTHNPNPLSITPSLIESFNTINISATIVGGAVEVSHLMLDYLGSKNITFFAHWYNDTSFNDTQVMQVRYSKFNISLPENVSYWEVFANSKDDKNLTPYKQTTSQNIWEITSQAYDDPFDVYLKTNETLNSCLDIWFSDNGSKKDYRDNSELNLPFFEQSPLFDYAYSGNVLNNNGAAWNRAGRFGGGYYFDGSSYMDYMDTAILDKDTDNFSMSAWFKTTQTTDIAAWGPRFMGKHEYGNFGGYGLGLASTGLIGKVMFRASTTVGGNQYLWTAVTSNTFNDGEWHHAVATRDVNDTTSGIKIYIDNVLEANTSQIAGNVTGPYKFTIGADNGGNEVPYIGWLDDVRMYNTTLSAAEVAIEFGKTEDYYRKNITTTYTQTVGNLSMFNSNGLWNWIDLTNCTNRFEMPWFYWSAHCVDCVNTTDFTETNLVVT